MEEILCERLNIFLCTESGKNLCGSEAALTDQNHVAALWVEGLKKWDFPNLFGSDWIKNLAWKRYFVLVDFKTPNKQTKNPIQEKNYSHYYRKLNQTLHFPQLFTAQNSVQVLILGFLHILKWQAVPYLKGKYRRLAVLLRPWSLHKGSCELSVTAQGWQWLCSSTGDICPAPGTAGTNQCQPELLQTCAASVWLRVRAPQGKTAFSGVLPHWKVAKRSCSSGKILACWKKSTLWNCLLWRNRVTFQFWASWKLTQQFFLQEKKQVFSWGLIHALGMNVYVVHNVQKCCPISLTDFFLDWNTMFQWPENQSQVF